MRGSANEPTLKIENARFIVTVDSQRRIIRDGSIVVSGNRIEQVGKSAELADVLADRIIDASEMVVTPGFCNGHIHISYAHATRGIFPPDLAVGEYLAYVFKLQAAMTEEEEYYTSLLAITELLRYGTTLFLDPGSTKFLDACLQAYAQSGCRIIVGSQVVDQPNPINLPQLSLSEVNALTDRTIRTYHGRLDGRVRVWAMPFSAEYASPDLLRAAKRLADRYQTGLTLHQVNTPTFIEMTMQIAGKRPVEYLEDLGVLGPNILLSHAMSLSKSEIDVLARTDTKVAICPTAALKMGQSTTRLGNLPEMLAKGVCVGLGTDAGNNSNLIDTTRAMYLTSVIYNDAYERSGVISPETVVEMATIQGARALGLDSDVGSIEVGKKADLVLFDTRRPEWRTIFNPINNLVYSADGRSVHTVIVDGRVVVEAYKPTYVDEERLIDKVQELGEELLARTGVEFPSKWPIV